MEWITKIQKAINYIEDHLMDEINYIDIAKHIYTSSYEFHRMFSFVTGMTVNTYIRNRRLSLAANDLLESNVRVIDVALKYGYETPESFTKAFSRFHGIAPKYVKENHAKLTLFNPLVIKIYIEGGRSMNYRIVQTKKQRFISIIKSFNNEIINDENNHDVPDFWQECINNKIIDELLKLRKEGKKDLYGLCSPALEGASTFEYGIGVLIDEDTLEITNEEMERLGFAFWDVVEGTYAVFECLGIDAKCISDTWTKFYKEFLPQTGYSALDATDYEVYFENGREGLFCELWIPIKK